MAKTGLKVIHNYVEITDAYRYGVSLVDTATDKVVCAAGANNILGVSRRVRNMLASRGYVYPDDENCPYVAYVKDKELDMNILNELPSKGFIDMDVIEERGIAYDIWRDEYLYA